MSIAETNVRTTAGCFAAIDYGGSGPACLLIHGTGQNAAAWRRFGAVLAEHYRVIAFDLRGHGQTRASSSDAEQYWRDIQPIVDALELARPILIGHSTGAYAAMAHAAAGGTAAAVVCVDGFTPDERTAPDAGARSWHATEQSLFERFRYGWRATQTQRDAYIDETVAAAPADPLNAGVDPELLRSMLARCFVETQGMWLRRPTLEEIGTVSTPPRQSTIGPDRTIYDRVTIPVLLIWAERGLSAARRHDIEGIAAAAANRTFVPISAGHNVPMERPVALARMIRSRLD